MKAFLVYRDRDFDLQQTFPPNEAALTQNLELNTLFNAMALGDKVLLEVAKKAILSSLNDLDAIQYRRDILRDSLKNPSIVREIYDIAVESIDREKKSYWSIFSNYPDAILRKAIEVLQIFAGMLKELRNVADALSRMSDIADQLRPNSMVLFSESFAATGDCQTNRMGLGGKPDQGLLRYPPV